MKTRNASINEFSINAGMGGLLSRSLLYTLSAEFERRGATQNDLVKENYAQLPEGCSPLVIIYSASEENMIEGCQ